MNKTLTRKIITVDGLAGSGKTAIAGLLAQELGFVHFNSGMVYRVYGYLAMQQGVNCDSLEQVSRLITENKLALSYTIETGCKMMLNNQPFFADLQQPEVSQKTSKLAALPFVRSALMDIQRNVFSSKDLVAEGRDMGTVVFPNASLKFFIQASVAVRVERRLRQLCEKEPNLNENKLNILKKQMEIEIVERDLRDTERSEAPTKPANDAIIIINEGQTLTAVVENMYATVARAGLV